MSKNLVIVESPAKAKTINKYLGTDFQVIASFGHVRDLVPKEGAVDTETFQMNYETVKKNKKNIDEILKAVKKTDAIYLATDPDREGEAISWHISELLKSKKLIKEKPVHRVAFYEITKSAVTEALSNPRTLSDDLINAQQARRALDYLVGFNLSPLLWKKIKYGLSAGRVQSPALRLIVEREKQIEAFIPKEYWSVTAECKQKAQPFTANLTRYENDKAGQFYITNESQATSVRESLMTAANGQLTVDNIDKKQRKRSPAPPFITSTLQQDASRKFGFSAKRTMRIAQQLYEGIDVGSGEEGLITYMRTDSVNMAQQALNEIRSFINSEYGKENCPDKPNFYKTKSKNAQEAHEAVRPTSVNLTPESIKKHLSTDQLKLYGLIWKRAVASQMVPAKINTVGIDFVCGDKGMFRATGSTIESPGYLQVYKVGVDDPAENSDEKILPKFEIGDHVDLKEIVNEQHFTKPPGRFSEATLIKALEEFGIGRPSTYAAIISTLTSREYVELEAKRFHPTDIGRVVNKFLTDHFTQYVDYEFTAQLEDKLDAISRGENNWIPLMEKFWKNFSQQVEEKEKIPRSEVIQSRVLGTDPKSGRPVSVRMAKYGAAAQIGTVDDEEKPLFASLLKEQRLESITLDEALKLFELPRELGESKDGEPISANVGRYGPYVRVGKKFVSIKDDDPYTITLERALELIAEDAEKKNNAVIKEFDDGNIQVLNGRYGPYVKSGKTNARIPKGKKPEELTQEECVELVEATAARKKKKKK
ncbi:MAG: type I DNA topoisomerase [Calditrichaeota bacterium]|nr:MAG: type I DNA topoisomerase [Calditrichota bacterium]MBL1207120.1 type I DNA topoisomerase [Calditrichota bacterium]NOG46950.1 type I DNA topoisomerase [Calditrichota bacterium]